VLGANPASRIAIDPARRNPVNFLAACSVMITRCHTSGAGELDACVMSAPRCKSPKPWEEASTELCCPAECWRQYEARRLAGVAPQAAFDMAMYGTDGGDTCVPLK
jgi:hypothetical protein